MLPRHGTAVESHSVPTSGNSLLREFPDGAKNFAWHFGGFRNPNSYYEFDLNFAKNFKIFSPGRVRKGIELSFHM